MRAIENDISADSEVSKLARRARAALERVCSGAGLDPASDYYAADLVDHVNDLEFRGLAGTRQSIELYTSVLSDLEITVEEQVVQGDRVTSRFVVTGRSYGRRVRFNGITISRFVEDRIVEDWSVTDTLGLVRQLGPWRSALAGMAQWWSLRGSGTRCAETGCRPAL